MHHKYSKKLIQNLLYRNLHAFCLNFLELNLYPHKLFKTFYLELQDLNIDLRQLN